MPIVLKRIRETVLVVDDNPAVLRTVVAILKGANFNVLSASNGADAVALSEKLNDKIDLLLSDVDMPLMTGPALGQVLKNSRPDLHVMLMSGGGAEGNLLVLNYGWAFIEKPFVNRKLIEMVTDVLDSPDRSQLGGREFDVRKD